MLGKNVLRIFILGAILAYSDGSLSQTQQRGPIFLLLPPNNVQFSSTEGTLLNCLAEGNPSPTISWMGRDGRPFLPPLFDVVDVLRNNQSLVFHPFTPERYRADVHSTMIRCKASNSFGTIISPPINIKAVVSQDYAITALAQEVGLGGTALLKCVIPTHLTSSLEILVWETQWKTIYPTQKPDGRYHMMAREGSLLVKEVTYADQLTPFICKVRSTLTHQIKESPPVRIKIAESADVTRPSIVNKVRSIVLKEGSTMTLPCVAKGKPTPTVSWTSYSMSSYSNYQYNSYNNQGTGSSNRFISKSSLGSNVLVISSENVSTGQSFTCTANNSLGIDQMSIEVNVQMNLKVEISPSYRQVDLGASATFSCNVQGPKTTVSWYKNGLPQMATGRIVITGQQLLISSVSHEDQGMYQCIAQGESETKQAQSQLVLGDSSPTFQYQFIEQTIQPGPPVALRCKASGNPLPSFRWTVNGLPIPLNSRINIRPQAGSRGEIISEVNISNTDIQDGGRYRCTASNRAGQDYHEANLNIYGPPRPRQVGSVNAVQDKQLRLYCPIAGHPLTSFTWSKDGVGVGVSGLGRGVTGNGVLVIEKVRRPEDAGVYTCRAANREGRSVTGSVQVAVLGNVGTTVLFSGRKYRKLKNNLKIIISTHDKYSLSNIIIFNIF